MPEREITPWAHPGWISWNEHAIEFQVAEFLGLLAAGVAERVSKPIVVETGTGQGYVTRRLIEALEAPTREDPDRGDHYIGPGPLLVYESNAEWRNQLVERDLIWVPRSEYEPSSTIQADSTPGERAYRDADLMIFDSMDPFRMGEVCMWAAMGKPGSLMFVHDASLQHPSWDGHYTLANLVRTLQIPGVWLENPRGGFIACQDSVDVPSWVHGLWANILESVYS